MRTMCSREIFTKKCRQQQIFDSDLKGAWHYNHVTFTPIAKNFMLFCRLIYMLSILCVRLTIKVKVGIPESFKVGWYHPKKTGSSHLNKVRKLYHARYKCNNKCDPKIINLNKMVIPKKAYLLSFFSRHYQRIMKKCKARRYLSLFSCNCVSHMTNYLTSN